MPENNKGFTFDDFVNMGAQSQGSQFNQFRGATQTAPLQTQRMPINSPVEQPSTGKPWNYPFDEEGLKYQTGENPVQDKGADINKAYDSVYSEQAKRNYVEESAKPKTAEPVNYTEQTFGLGGSLNFKDQGAKREVLRFIGAKQNAHNINYQVNREATQKAREAGDNNAIIYDFNVEDTDGNEYEINGVSANSLSELFARLRKPEASKEAVLSDSPRRVRKKGEDWRLDINAPIEDGLVSIEKTTDFERDLGEFGSRMLAGISGTAANLVVGAGQGLMRAASYFPDPMRNLNELSNRNKKPEDKREFIEAADAPFFIDAKTRANNLVQNYGPENQFVGAAASGIGSVAAIAPLGTAGLAGAAAASFEDGVQYSRELSDRNGEERSDFRDVAMGLGYGTAEFLAERVGLQSIKRAINPTAARKIGERMINEAMTSSPNILPRLFQATKGTGIAAAVNYAEEFATNLGQEGINDLFYEVDRDLWKTVQDANLAGIGGAFGGGVTTVAGQAAQSIAGAAGRGVRNANNETLNYNNLQSNTNQGTSLPVNNTLSAQENYAITRLQRLGFTEQDALDEVIANRTGQKANTESRKQILEEFPESQAAVEGLLNKAKKVYGDSATKVRNLFGGARAEVDASVDEQIAAAETILTPEPAVAPEAPTTPEEAPVQEQPIVEAPIQEEAPVVEEELSQATEDLEFSDDYLNSLIDEYGTNPEDIDATIAQEEQVAQEEVPTEEPAVTDQTTPVKERKTRTRGRKKDAAAQPAEEGVAQKEDSYIENTGDETILEGPSEETIDPLMRISAIKESLKGFEFSIEGALTASARKSTLLNIAAKKLGIDKSLLKIEGGAINYSTPEGETIKVATIEKGRKLTFNEQDIDNYTSATFKKRTGAKLAESRRLLNIVRENNKELAKAGKAIPNFSSGSLRKRRNSKRTSSDVKDIEYEEVSSDIGETKQIPASLTKESPNSTEGSTPGKRKTRAQRAKDVVNKAGEKLTDAIDKEIADRKGAALDITGIFTSPLLKVIRLAGITMQTTAVKALDIYIDLQAQAVENGTTSLRQAINNVRDYIQTNFAQGKAFVADNEIADIINSTVADIPKRAERDAKKAAGLAKYEENMSKAEKNKAAKEVKSKAKTVIQGIVQKANKGLIDKHDEITILPSLLKLAERLEVNEAFIRQEYNEAVAALRIPNTSLNTGRESLADVRNYVTKYAQTLLNSSKNDLIKNKLVYSILGRIDKLRSYAGILEQLEYIKKVINSAAFANRLNDAKSAVATAINKRKSTPGADKLIKSLKLIFALADYQDLETLERIEAVSKELAKTSSIPETLLKEVNDIAVSLKLPVAKEAKEEKDEKDKKGVTEKDIQEAAAKAKKGLQSALDLIKDVTTEKVKVIRNLLGIKYELDINETMDALENYDKENINDVKKLATFFENIVGIYNSMVADTGMSFEDFLYEQFSTKTGFDIPDTILRIRAEKTTKDLKAANVDTVISGVAGVFDKANKKVALRLLLGNWLGDNKRRTLQQTIDRLVNYSSDAAFAVEKAFRLPLLAAFTRAETDVSSILHTITLALDAAKLEKDSYIHMQTFGMVLDYLTGNSINHNYALFVENARDIKKKIENGLLDKNNKNVKDAKIAIEWFDKAVGKYSEDTNEFDGPMAKVIQALDGSAIDNNKDIISVIKSALGSNYTTPLLQIYQNIRDAGESVRNNSMVYKQQQIDNRPFYWPRKAVGKIDSVRKRASNEYFDDSQYTAGEIDRLIKDDANEGTKTFNQISTKTNPHSLARAQNKDIVYSLNAYDVAATYFTNSFNDLYVTPELIRINKALKGDKATMFTSEGTKALTQAIILFSKSAYNVGYKKFSSPLLKALDPIIGEASRIMLGSYTQILKQSMPAIAAYVSLGEGDIRGRASAINNVIRNKENLAILADIMALRTEKAKEKTRKRFTDAQYSSQFDFGVSRSNAVIDAFRELSSQQGSGTYVDKLYEVLDKTWLTKKYAGFIRDTSAALPVTDSYARLIIYAAEIERRSGMSFADFMSGNNRSAKNERIIAESDKAVNRIMGSSFSKERSKNLTMTSDSDLENLWKKMNFFMGNALAQNSTTFKDSVTAAILDPANRGAHAKRAGMVAANAVVFSGISAGIAAGLNSLFGAIGYAISGEEEEEEEDSISRGILGGTAKVVVDLFYGNAGNAMSMLATYAINEADYQARKSQEMSAEEGQEVAMNIIRAYQAKRLSREGVIKEFEELDKAMNTSDRSLLYQGAKSYGRTAQWRPVLSLMGPYKAVGGTSADIYDLIDKSLHSEEGPKSKEYIKALTNLSRMIPLMQPDIVKLAALTAKEFNKERKQDVKKPNRR
jgi:hypothetical protein